MDNNIKIRSIGAPTNDSQRNITVETNKTIFSNFMSFGANMFAGILTDEGKKATDMNDVFFEFEEKRFLSAKPQFNRYFFYVDWMITNVEPRPARYDWENNLDYINYANGIYDFENEKMKAFFRYFDVLKKCGSATYLNFGFKQANRLLKWFGLNENRNDPAPREVDLFVNACISLIKEILNRGYDNLMGVAFYNEPDGLGFSTDGILSKDEVLSEITLKVEKRLRLEGLRDKIMVFGPEMANVRPDNHHYLDYMEEYISECLDGYTVHSYYWTKADRSAGVTRPVDYDMMFELGGFLRENFSHPAYLTEFNTGNYDWDETATGKTAFYSEGSEWTWKSSNASLFIACANSGYLGACRWSYSGQYWSDPIRYGSYEKNYHSLWRGTVSLEAIENGVMEKFYSDSLFTNYVKHGSDVLFVDWSGEDTRVAAFRLPDENYTVVVEVMETSENRDIEIKFDVPMNKRFYRMHSSHSINKNGNAIVPTTDKIFDNVKSDISDTLSGEYGVYVYTTCTPIKQVELDRVTMQLKSGDSYRFVAKTIDCETEDDIVWSISSNLGDHVGTINQNGLYTAADTARPGDLVAIRATLNSDPSVYGVAVIQIIK